MVWKGNWRQLQKGQGKNKFEPHPRGVEDDTHERTNHRDLSQGLVPKTSHSLGCMKGLVVGASHRDKSPVVFARGDYLQG